MKLCSFGIKLTDSKVKTAFFSNPSVISGLISRSRVQKNTAESNINMSLKIEKISCMMSVINLRMYIKKITLKKLFISL